MNLTKLAAAAVLVASAGAAFAAPQAVNPGGSLGTNPDGVSFVGLANGVSTFYFDLVDMAPAGFVSTFDLSADFWSVFAPATINGITVTGGSFSDTVTATGTAPLGFGTATDMATATCPLCPTCPDCPTPGQ